MSDNYHTPAWIKGLFPNYFDPCPYDPEWDETKYNGLTDEWYGSHIFINPPYSNPKPWVERAIQESYNSVKTIVLLLKHDSSTQWFRMLHEAGAKFLMFQGRLDFAGPNAVPNSNAPFPSVLAILS